MISINTFTFNYFAENTYVLFDETGECMIIDPGCYTASERKELSDFIDNNKLTPVALVNTHGHIDHILGNAFVANKYKLPLQIHPDELQTIAEADVWSRMFNIQLDETPADKILLGPEGQLKFGNTTLEILFTPGHSRASLSFYCEAEQFVIGGDVLFNGSIGRTDLPGGDFKTLIHSIQTKLLVLDDDVKVYPGHGPYTTIGFEKRNNPYIA